MTKRLLSVVVAVLMVMALIPMSVFAANADTRSGKVAEKTDAKTLTASKDAVVTFDFEYTAESQFDWAQVDADGDGYGWGWVGYGINQTQYANSAYEGIGYINSLSYDSGTILYPDNYVITPAVDVPEDGPALTFWVEGQDPSYVAEHYMVLAGTSADVAEMEVIMPETVATNPWVQKTIDLSAFAGETIYVAFRHFNCSDMFQFNIDYVCIEGNVDIPEVTTAPTSAPVDPPAEGNATVILNVPEDHWQDGSGYQMLIDADANTYGTIIPTTGALTTGGDVPDSVYAEFEYKIPENAAGALTTSHIVSCASVAIEIPAGVYDWCITNPTPGDRMWIASSQGNVGGRYDDYEFLAGNTYEFVVTLQGSNDAVNVTITGENVPEVPDLNEALNVEGGTLEFTTDAAYPWTVVGTGANAYAKSGNSGISSSTSTLTLNVTAEAGDTLSFDFKAWGEGSSTFWDHCDFIVNGDTEFTYGAYDNEWETYTYTCAEAGDYEFVWSYTKDSSVNPTGDYFAVDNVEFTGEGGTTPVEPTDEPIDEPQLINEIRVYGFEAPVEGDVAGNHLNLTVPEDAPYYIEEAYWWNETEWHRLLEDDVFENGSEYSVIVKVVPYEGNTFEQKVRFFADDSTETIDWNYTERESDVVAWLAVLPMETVMSDLDRALNVEGGTIHFTSTGNYPWFTVDDGERFYAQSGNAGVASSSSTVTATVEAAEGDIVMFDFMAWGEGTSWDVCTFAVDGTVVLSYGAYDNDWETFMYGLTPGTHNLNWTYTKDSSVNPTGDFFAVDEVYVGEPIPVESIEASIENPVPVNRTKQIEWTVLPTNAYNQEVTFVSDDESIATVNQNGVVFGVAEGETFVTVTSVENPDIFAVVEIEVVDMGYFMSNIYGMDAYDPTGATQDKWIAFSNGNPADVTAIGDIPSSYAAAYAAGTIYGMTTDGSFYTAEFTPDAIGDAQIVATGCTDMTVISMTFDYSHGALFGSAIDGNDVCHLIGIDKENGTVYELAEMPFAIMGIAADGEGYAYGINFDNGDLVKIDLESYDVVTVGSTGYGVNYVQDMCYDFDHNCLFWAQYVEEGTLLQIDPDTAEVTEVCGLIGAAGSEVVGMFVLPEVEPEINEGPFEVTDVEIIPEEIEIYVGETFQFNVKVTPFYATDKLVEWDVDDEAIITVDQDGVVEGVALGTASVYATCNDITAFAIVNVINPPVMGFYFETDPEAEGWVFTDEDYDGNTWMWTMGSPDYAYEGEGFITSESYINYVGPLTPDNFAISPAVEVPGMNAKVTLYARGQDPAYAAEHFAIYAGLTPNVEDMVQVSDEFVATGTYVKYEADLSEFAGQTAYIAIRHYNTTDEFRLNIDQVEIWGKNMLWGDANGDGVVDTVDALLLMRWVMGIEELDEENLDPWCDVNGDGVIDFTDALLIARKVMGIIDLFPVEIGD